MRTFKLTLDSDVQEHVWEWCLIGIDGLDPEDLGIAELPEIHRAQAPARTYEVPDDEDLLGEMSLQLDLAHDTIDFDEDHPVHPNENIVEVVDAIRRKIGQLSKTWKDA